MGRGGKQIRIYFDLMPAYGHGICNRLGYNDDKYLKLFLNSSEWLYIFTWIHRKNKTNFKVTMFYLVFNWREKILLDGSFENFKSFPQK